METFSETISQPHVDEQERTLPGLLQTMRPSRSRQGLDLMAGDGRCSGYRQVKEC